MIGTVRRLEVSVLRCPGCGTYASPGASFCAQCAGRLAEGSAPAYPDRPPGPPVTWGRPPYPGARPDGDPETWVDDQQAPWPVDPTWGQDEPSDWAGHVEQPPPVDHGAWPQAGYPYGGSPPPLAPDPRWETAPGHNNRGRVILFSAVALVVVLGLVGGGLFLTKGGRGADRTAGGQHSGSASPVATGSSDSTSTSRSTTGSGATPDAQAKAVNAVLDKATRGKNSLSGAYEKAVACKISPAKAKKKFAATAKNRRGIVRKARKLHTSKLPRGATIKRRLIAMYKTSAKADQAFTKWARAGDTARADCLKANAKRRKGNRLSVKAGKLKGKFTKVWNPVARKYDYETRSKDDL